MGSFHGGIIPSFTNLLSQKRFTNAKMKAGKQRETTPM